MTHTVLAGIIALGSGLPPSAEVVNVYVRDRLTGAPIANAIIILVSDDPTVRTVLTDEDGEARIALAPSKTVYFSIRSPQHSTRCFSTDDVSQGSLTADLDASGRMYGTVREPNGRPVAGAVVRLSLERDRACRVHIPPQPVRTDAEGRYLLRNVDFSRPFALRIERNGHQPVFFDRANAMATSMPADLPPAGAEGPRRELNLVVGR